MTCTLSTFRAVVFVLFFFCSKIISLFLAALLGYISPNSSAVSIFNSVSPVTFRPLFLKMSYNAFQWNWQLRPSPITCTVTWREVKVGVRMGNEGKKQNIQWCET